MDLHKQSRQYHAEGFMIKAIESQYREGRKRGDWWKWKVNPMTVDAVLLYANRGRADGQTFTAITLLLYGLQTIRKPNTPAICQSYSGLTDKEITEVDKFVKKNTKERFGPVRKCPMPQLVMEIGFEDIRKSTRHKSGFAVRFPRIMRWRKDKPLDEIDSMNRLQHLLDDKQGGG